MILKVRFAGEDTMPIKHSWLLTQGVTLARAPASGVHSEGGRGFMVVHFVRVTLSLENLPQPPLR